MSGISCHWSKKFIGLLHVGVPHRPRRRDARLRAAVVQARDRRAVGAVDVEGDEVVAAHARRPRHVDLRDDRLAVVALELARWRRRRRRRWPRRACRPRPSARGCAWRRGTTPTSLRRTGCRARSASGTSCRGSCRRRLPCGSSTTGAGSAAGRPRTPSSRTRTRTREHAAEEAGAAQHVELAQAGQEELVLHHAVLQARRLRPGARSRRASFEVGGDRLLAVDVLAGARCALAEQRRAHLRRAGVEEDRVVLVLQRRVEVGAPALDAVRLGQRLDLLGVAADRGSGRA